MLAEGRRSLPDPRQSHRPPAAYVVTSKPPISVERRRSDPPGRGRLSLGCKIDAVAKPMVESALKHLPVLAAECAEFWLIHGPDAEHGGFHGRIGRRGQPCDPTDKGAIQQARHLWTWSTWYERREPTERVRQAAELAYTFLVDHFLDPEDGEFAFRVDRAGRVLDSRKLLYAQGFAIYALASYASVFGVPRARDLALRCFESIDGRAHDAAHGGYDLSSEREWTSPGTEKETNTHIHLMEAFTALYAVTRDSRVEARLAEMSEICATRLLQPSGYVHKEFLGDWTPRGTPSVSYGHDLETAWLLVDAELTLGQPRAHVVAAATRMACHAAHYGFDAERGGYFEEGLPHGPVTGFEKIWWVQFEALPGLWWTYRLTAEPLYLERLIRTIEWLESGQRDPDHGEWFWGVLPDGTLGIHGDTKGEVWKAAYHNLRALTITEDWMVAGLRQASL